jgi:hypothetical protein
MKTRTHFTPRIDMLDAAGEVQEHLAGVENYMRCAGGSGDFLAPSPPSEKATASRNESMLPHATIRQRLRGCHFWTSVRELIERLFSSGGV